jgi:hypothetical protein
MRYNEGMTPQLSADLQSAIDHSHGLPVRVEDPRTHKTYLLIESDQAAAWITASSPPSDEWSDARNARRCELVRKKFAAGLSDAEAVELAELQAAAGRYREQFEPMAATTIRALEVEIARVRHSNGNGVEH